MKDRLKSYIFIIIVAIIVSIPLLNNKINIYIDDGIQHICRLMGTYQSISEGQTFPVIMSKFCNNFGYSWNLFYSPATAYIPLLFSIFTKSFVQMLKLFMIFISALSGITMYEFLYKVTKNKNAGILGAVLYIFAPYRLTDMYLRVAVAELASFVFLPVVFQGLFVIFCEEENNKKSGYVLLIIGAVGLILTHIIIAMYTAIFGAIYVLCNIKKLKNKEIIKNLVVCLILILGITSFYLAPMLEHKFNTEYEVFQPGRMERTEVLIQNKVDFLELFYTRKGNFAFEIGLVILIGLVFSLLVYKKVEKHSKKLYIFFIVAGISSVIISLKWFPFEKLPAILKMLQFSFRMLEFSSFFLCTVVAINYYLLIKNFNIKDVIILSIITILLTVPLTKNLQYQENIRDEKELWPAKPVTQYTGRVHAGLASFEYLPSKAFKNLDYIKTREDRVYIINQSAIILEEYKDGTNMKVKIKDAKKDTILELPYIYYLGYKAELETNGNRVPLNISESENGFIQVKLDDDLQEATITVWYSGDSIMKVSAIISILSFTAFIIYAIKKRGCPRIGTRKQKFQ